jgi:hypothetical protein
MALFTTALGLYGGVLWLWSVERWVWVWVSSRDSLYMK